MHSVYVQDRGPLRALKRGGLVRCDGFFQPMRVAVTKDAACRIGERCVHVGGTTAVDLV